MYNEIKEYNSQPYYYHRNLQGDVIAIYDENGEKQVEYAYAFMQTPDKYLIIGKKAAVVITSAGQVITTWDASHYGPKIIEAIGSIFGF